MTCTSTSVSTRQPHSARGWPATRDVRSTLSRGNGSRRFPRQRARPWRDVARGIRVVAHRRRGNALPPHGRAGHTLPLGVEALSAGKLVELCGRGHVHPVGRDRMLGSRRIPARRGDHLRTSGKVAPFDTTRHPNPNIAVFAASGHGKSFAIGTLVLEAAVTGVNSVIIDPEGEYRGLVARSAGATSSSRPAPAPQSTCSKAPAMIPKRRLPRWLTSSACSAAISSARWSAPSSTPQRGRVSACGGRPPRPAPRGLHSHARCRRAPRCRCGAPLLHRRPRRPLQPSHVARRRFRRVRHLAARHAARARCGRDAHRRALVVGAGAARPAAPSYRVRRGWRALRAPAPCATCSCSSRDAAASTAHRWWWRRRTRRTCSAPMRAT